MTALPAWALPALIALNLLAFALFAADKTMAKAGTLRIPERILLLSAFAFGSVGAWLAMQLLRHKTDDRTDPRRKVFTLGVPASFLCQAALLLTAPAHAAETAWLAGLAAYALIFGLLALTRRSTHAKRRRRR